MSEGINPELIEKAAQAMHADNCIDDDCDHYVNEWERDAEVALAAVLPDAIRQAKAEAWDEGAEAAWGRSAPEVNGQTHLWRHEGEPLNPYRQEAKA